MKMSSFARFEKFDNFHSGKEFVKFEKLVQSAFDMDTLGIKDKVQSSGLLKNFKKPKSEWMPLEKEIDASMVVTLHPATKNCPKHYLCGIPWKNEVPCLENYMKQVIARQYKTNYGGYLTKKVLV